MPGWLSECVVLFLGNSGVLLNECSHDATGYLDSEKEQSDIEKEALHLFTLAP